MVEGHTVWVMLWRVLAIVLAALVSTTMRVAPAAGLSVYPEWGTLVLLVFLFLIVGCRLVLVRARRGIDEAFDLHDSVVV